jgi:hypothetical protein
VGMLLFPLKSMAADLAVFDQFADAFGAGLFQGMQSSSEVRFDSYSDDGNTQGGNVIATYYSGKVVQIALVESSLTLTMSEGNSVIQGVNVYQGNADSITQMTVISGSVAMSSQNNTGGIQGINVITHCDSCN